MWTFYVRSADLNLSGPGAALQMRGGGQDSLNADRLRILAVDGKAPAAAAAAAPGRKGRGKEKGGAGKGGAGKA